MLTTVLILVGGALLGFALFMLVITTALLWGSREVLDGASIPHSRHFTFPQ